MWILSLKSIILLHLLVFSLFEPSSLSAAPPSQHANSLREVGPLPVITPISIFDWGLRRNGIRQFGVYGRLIKTAGSRDSTAQDHTLPDRVNETATFKWVYRGQITQAISWVTSRPLSLQELGNDGPIADPKHLSKRGNESELTSLYQEESNPSDLDDLKRLYLSVKDSVRILPDPITKTPGYELEEWRIFEATPPYQLISFDSHRVDVKGSESLRFIEGRWSVKKQPASQRNLKEFEYIDIPPPAETLHTRLFDSDSYHVGGGFKTEMSYIAPQVSAQSQSKELEFKVIDRRYERLSGTWTERVEWSTPHLFGSLDTRVILDHKRMIRGIFLNDQLFALERSHSQIHNREPLPFELRPISLKGLQSQAGRISPKYISQLTQTVRPQLERCLEVKEDESSNPTPRAHIVLRLNMSDQGLLLAAGATHQLSWKQTRCVLQSISSLNVPPLSKAKELSGASQHSRESGAMIALPLSLPSNGSRSNK